MRVYATVALVLGIAACMSPVPDRTYYLLRYEIPPGVEAVPMENAVSLARVSVADYLTRPGLAIEMKPNEVRAAHDHLWAEPLAAGVRAYLRGAIGAQADQAVLAELGPGRSSGPEVRVFIEEFHGTMSGEARLVAHFQVVPPGGAAPREVRFARAIALASSGYAALVEAERKLLDQLAGAIAAALR